MNTKKTDLKFTILFNQNDPVHLQAVDILKRQPQRGKAHYIAKAITYYENFNGVSDKHSPAQIDEKYIEMIVNKLLRNRQGKSEVDLPASVSDNHADNQEIQQSNNAEEINFDDAMDALGEDGFNAVAGALDMFRRK